MQWAVIRAILTLNVSTRSAASNASALPASLAADIDVSVSSLMFS